MSATTDRAPARSIPSMGVSTGTDMSFGARIALGGLMLLTALLAFAPVAILGPAIGWPASLARPAADQLQLIAAQVDAVRLGYASYLLYSVLLLPACAALLRRWPVGADWHALIMSLLSLSVLARSVGILRWLTAMPQLASQHALADTPGRTLIEMQFQALNSWGGGIGELLGVSLFMGLALTALAWAGWQARWPRWMYLGALGCAMLLYGLAGPLVGVSAKVPTALAVSALSLWLAAMSVSCMRR
ncbi:hypothetical protein IP84_01515 [beta proteobacterium AAP99]|nr:hypothetical protein IP84_01515 [beta proteobacterium AAP99]